MNERKLGCFAGVCALIGGLVLVGALYLTFVFPRTLAAWAEQERYLSALELALANFSGFCGAYGIVLIPALLLIVIGFGFLAWRTRSVGGRGGAGM